MHNKHFAAESNDRPANDPVFTSPADMPRTMMVNYQTGFDMMRSGRFEFRTPEEAEQLARFLAHFFSEPHNIVTGLAELMFNAIEHGNLEIGFDLKREFLQSGRWQAEIHNRLQNPRYGKRKAEVTLTHKDGGTYIVISDEGSGFDWKQHMKIDPSRADQPHGRGIAHAASVCFDKLSYNESGNKAVAFVKDGGTLAW